MKSKILAVIMVVLLLGMSLAACGGNESAAEKESTGGGGAPVEKSADDSESAEKPESKTDDSDDAKGKNGVDPTKKLKTSTDGELKIVEKGYSYSGGYVNAAAIVRNYNSEDAYENTTATITVYGDDDNILGTEEAYISFIHPGEVQAASTSINTNGKKPKKVDIELNEGDEANVDDDKVPAYQIIAMNFSENEDKDLDWVNITGQIDNKSEKDIGEVGLVLILRNKGKIVYVESNYVENVKAKKKKAFELEFLEDVPEHDSTQVYTSDESI